VPLIPGIIRFGHYTLQGKDVIIASDATVGVPGETREAQVLDARWSFVLADQLRFIASNQIALKMEDYPRFVENNNETIVTKAQQAVTVSPLLSSQNVLYFAVKTEMTAFPVPKYVNLNFVVNIGSKLPC